jgi:hypothetical protein
MRRGEGADYDAITFDNFYHWWIDHKDDKHSLAGGPSKKRSKVSNSQQSAPCSHMKRQCGWRQFTLSASVHQCHDLGRMLKMVAVPHRSWVCEV